MVKLFASIAKSIGKAIAHDPEVRRYAEKYPSISRFLRNRLTPDERFGLYLTVGFSSALLFSLFFFKIVDALVDQAVIVQMDVRVLNLVQIFRSDGFNQVMLFTTYLGKGEVVTLGIALLLIFFVLINRRHYILAFIVSAGGGEIFVSITKHLTHRSRPPLGSALYAESGFSFPSGHTFIAVAFYGLLTYVLMRRFRGKWKKLAIFAAGILVIFAIGYSRIYLGVHWFSDVIGSYALGFAWVSIIITALEHRKTSRPGVDPPALVSRRNLVLIGGSLVLVWGVFVSIFYREHPLPAPAVKSAERVMVAPQGAIVEALFSRFPRQSENMSGVPRQPISLVIVGTKESLSQALSDAGWLSMDTLSFRSLSKATDAVIWNDAYPQAPGTPAFWNNRPNDFAFEQPTEENTARKRYHIHFWSTPFVTPDGRDAWVANTHFDEGFKLTSALIVPSHVIDPAVDRVRDKVEHDLVSTGRVASSEPFQNVDPMLGQNEAGDSFFTDGKAYLIFLR